MEKSAIIEMIRQKFMGKAVCPVSGTCCYLTGSGKKCAIGIFIPDGHIAQTNVANNMSVYGLLQSFPDLLQHMPTTNIELLNKMQDVHDFLHESLTVEQQKQALINFVELNF